MRSQRQAHLRDWRCGWFYYLLAVACVEGKDEFHLFSSAE